MLPGLGFSEILVLAVIALLVVGPRDLPLMLRKLGRQMAKMRALANEFRTGFDELARQAELDELKKEVEALRRGQFAEPVFSDIERDFAKIDADPEPVATRKTLPRPEHADAEPAPPTEPQPDPVSETSPAIDPPEPLKAMR